MTLPFRTQPSFATLVGSPAAQPAAGRVVTMAEYDPESRAFRLNFILKGARITVTDATTSGSSGSLKLFTFIQQAISILGCRQDYTRFAEGEDLTTAAGDAAFVMALGSAAANAGDAALTGTEADIGAVTGTITLSDGDGAGSKVSGAGLNSSAGLDGTGTAVDVYLNWSGSAATIDANSTIDVWGTITVTGVLLGDD